MKLNLEKNEIKESESYPNVSFMSTDHFERGKPPTKSAICTIKRHERRKSSGMIFIRKNKKQISDTSKTSQILN